MRIVISKAQFEFDGEFLGSLVVEEDGRNIERSFYLGRDGRIAVVEVLRSISDAAQRYYDDLARIGAYGAPSLTREEWLRRFGE